MERGTIEPLGISGPELSNGVRTRSDNAPCVGCGLCCDGTIYVRARAQPDEVERLTAAGLTVVRDSEKVYFSHPCRFAAGGLCTIYDEPRFHVCSSFRCKLLKAYHDGDISREEAFGKVQQALALRSAVTAEAPEARLYTERRRLGLELAALNERPHLRLAIAALDHFLGRWFGKLPKEAR